VVCPGCQRELAIVASGGGITRTDSTEKRSEVCGRHGHGLAVLEDHVGDRADEGHRDIRLFRGHSFDASPGDGFGGNTGTPIVSNQTGHGGGHLHGFAILGCHEDDLETFVLSPRRRESCRSGEVTDLSEEARLTIETLTRGQHCRHKGSLWLSGVLSEKLGVIPYPPLALLFLPAGLFLGKDQLALPDILAQCLPTSRVVVPKHVERRLVVKLDVIDEPAEGIGRPVRIRAVAQDDVVLVRQQCCRGLAVLRDRDLALDPIGVDRNASRTEDDEHVMPLVFGQGRGCGVDNPASFRVLHFQFGTSIAHVHVVADLLGRDRTVALPQNGAEVVRPEGLDHDLDGEVVTQGQVGPVRDAHAAPSGIKMQRLAENARAQAIGPGVPLQLAMAVPRRVAHLDIGDVECPMDPRTRCAGSRSEQNGTAEQDDSATCV